MTKRRFPLASSIRFGRTLLFSLFVMLAASSVSRAGGVDILDQDGGLPDAQIGAPLKAFSGLRETENTGRWLSYTRDGGPQAFLGIPVKGVTYNFFKERLYSINLDIVGKRDTRKLLRTLEERYGADHSFDTQSYPKINSQMEIREWKGVKLYCVYKSSSEFEGGVLTLLDKPTWDQLQIPKHEKEAESRSLLKGSFLNGDF